MMHRSILLITSFLLGILIHAQQISGKITDENGAPISGVNVYIDGSQIFTQSDGEGNYVLNANGQSQGQVVFQKEGYEDFIQSVAKLIENRQTIQLFKYSEIEEIVIIPYTDKAYRDFINYFLETFIGSDQKNVKIKNVKTLKFAFDKEKQLLKVKAPEVLQIQNKNLGYDIQYKLLKYESDFRNKTIVYLGTSFFKSTSDKNKIKLNRLHAYYGSFQHFIRTIYQGNLDKEGFVVNHIRKIPNPKYPSAEELQKLQDYYDFIKKGGSAISINLPDDLREISQRKSKESETLMAVVKTQIPVQDFVVSEGGKKFLQFDDILQVVYHKFPYELKGGGIVKSAQQLNVSSFLYLDGNSFEIDAEGNTSDPANLMVDGYFSRMKLEQLLPSDFRVEK